MGNLDRIVVFIYGNGITRNIIGDRLPTLPAALSCHPFYKKGNSDREIVLDSENLITSFGDSNGVLELCREFFVSSPHRPAVALI